MKREELPLAVEWAVAGGRNPGPADAECFWPEDPEGSFCAVVDGKMVPVFHTARLYPIREPVPLPPDGIFGVTTFELG